TSDIRTCIVAEGDLRWIDNVCAGQLVDNPFQICLQLWHPVLHEFVEGDTRRWCSTTSFHGLPRHYRCSNPTSVRSCCRSWPIWSLLSARTVRQVPPYQRPLGLSDIYELRRHPRPCGAY